MGAVKVRFGGPSRRKFQETVEGGGKVVEVVSRGIDGELGSFGSLAERCVSLSGVGVSGLCHIRGLPMLYDDGVNDMGCVSGQKYLTCAERLLSA